MRTLGVVGTLVWDRVVPVAGMPREGWGGISYALAAAAFTLPPDWAIRPVVRVGTDLEPAARRFLSSLPRVETDHLVPVPEPNNRVELRYRDDEHRTERLTGGVSGWQGDDFACAIDGCDCLLVNFISGFEVGLEVLEVVLPRFQGLKYADLHSLFLGVAPDGTRVARPLRDWRRWVACFDAVQVNESEFALIREGPDGADGIGEIVDAGPRLAVVTRGGLGATLAVHTEGARPTEVDVTLRAPRTGDPTGCGDVWGATMCARLLAGDAPPAAAEAANRVASASVGHGGADGLVEYLHREVRF